MRHSLFAAAALLTATLAAHADTIKKFYVTGILPASEASLGGTVTIDTTTGIATAIDLSVTAPYALSFTSLGNQVSNYASTPTDLLIVTSGAYALYLLFPTPTLVGYQGGSLNYAPNQLVSNIAFNGQTQERLDGTVSATPPSASSGVTPEPSTLLLLGTGLLGGAGTCLRRLRASRAA